MVETVYRALKISVRAGLDAVKHLEYVIVDIAIQNQKSSSHIGVWYNG